MPRVDLNDKKMRRWVERQREKYKKGKLKPDYVQLLNNIGFVWDDVLEKQWLFYYKKLKRYKKLYGDLNISEEDDPKLYNWKGNQLRAFRKGKLPSRRAWKLKKLGFH